MICLRCLRLIAVSYTHLDVYKRQVGLDYEEYKDKSPFDLSGGQKRRVAIAGVIAMNPKTLILDEPTAGLDPKGRDDILAQIKKLHDDYGMTIILVSHSTVSYTHLDVYKRQNKIIVLIFRAHLVKSQQYFHNVR